MKDKRIHEVKVKYNQGTKSSSGGRLQPYQKAETWEESISMMNFSSKKEKKFWYNFLAQMKEDRKTPIQWRTK